VITPQRPEADEVLEERARSLGAPLFRFGREWQAFAGARGGLRYEGRRWRLDLPPPALLGPHQYVNAGAAIACLDALDGFDITTDALARGLGTVEWPARLQRLTRGPLVAALPDNCELWLDGGHNEAGGAALAEATAAWRDRPLRLVFGMIETHDARAFLRSLAPLVAGLGAVAIPGEAHSLSAEAAAEAARAVGITATAQPDIAAAVAATAAPDSRVLICGSLYLAGRVLRENG
jgi:dihydrofolate synthase/folylpolyglutamate synthase